MRKDNKEAINKELKELGSSLPRENKNAGFETPEGYFDNLGGDILSRVREAEPKQALGVPFRPKQVLAVAASLLLLVSLTISLFFMRSDTVNDYAALDEHGVDFEYFSLRSDFDHQEIYDMVLDSDLSADEILYELELHDEGDMDAYDEMMEMLFEEAGYYGIESNYLLSSLD